MPNPAIPGVASPTTVPPNTPAVQVHQRSNAIPAHPVVAAQAAVAANPPRVEAVNEWDALVNDLDGIEAPESPPSPSQAAPQQAAAAPGLEGLPSLDDLAALAVPAQPPQLPNQPPTAEVPQGVQLQAQPPAAPPNLEEVQKQAIAYLMANDYKLDDEQRRQLIAEPDAVLPAMAARMHVGIATGITQQIMQLLPTIIDQQVQGRLAAQRAEMEFFGDYPQLKGHREIVAQSLEFVRRAEPNISREELKKKGAAWAVFQIRSRGVQAQPQQVPIAQPQFAQLPAAPRLPQAPFVPAAPGAGALPPTPGQPGNIWADLANDPDLMNF